LLPLSFNKGSTHETRRTHQHISSVCFSGTTAPAYAQQEQQGEKQGKPEKQAKPEKQLLTSGVSILNS